MMTREKLDTLRCTCSANDDACDHGPLVLSGRCHMGSPTVTTYARGGLLTLRCSECDRIVAKILVADSREEALALALRREVDALRTELDSVRADLERAQLEGERS